MAFLGQMECAGYTWTVLAETEQRARDLLRDEFRLRVAAGDVVDVAAGDPEEYFGMSVNEVVFDSVLML
jgi:hypothetical protein